ncbi:DoxX family protein [Pseudoteredinibacter isoporae]|uniref:Putative oxidoreductase n=1 Tax=Pseudoteredinibacter isoporae TaxID=570281 RepID=A0A7X0JX62_9GAMM|nr:DoxX family protein [Pseudoteredinibacter isoporae]MBB6523046.1 putative oxidoreductase [Pseudoteredinibacter isoporae]NHO88567.1 DoxX family protein [Pseudoteredinibacter isoporae]NIB22742.1 DoxX family protein [Pseudoteredinibacter isoporae]
MIPQNPNALLTSGRLLLALYFLLPGLMKFAQFEMHLGLMNRHGVAAPELMLVIAGLANVLGALLLIFNRHVRLVALGFVAYIILVNLMLHDFWNFEGIEARHELQNFIKNLGILAGLLALAGASAKRTLRLSDIHKSDASV